MKGRSKNLLILLLLAVLLLACQTESTPQPPEDEDIIPTATPTSPVPTNTVIPPTQTLTITPSRMPSLTLTPSPTADTPATDAEGNLVCVAINPEISIDTAIFEKPEFQNELGDYLNAGGDPLELPQYLASDPSDEEPNLIAVYQPDFDSDQIADVLVIVTLSISGGYGESHVYAFLCRNGGYESHILFRRAGAGSRGEGLYAGGGAQIERLEDLNQTGNIDLLFSVNWPGYAEYFLLTWEGDQFRSLISYMDELGLQRSYFEVQQGNFKLEDVDGDGVFELLVIPINSQTSAFETWYWDGEQYQLLYE
jgi:hypothetical protein